MLEIKNKLIKWFYCHNVIKAKLIVSFLSQIEKCLHNKSVQQA